MNQRKYVHDDNIKIKIILPVLITFAFILVGVMAGMFSIQKISNKEQIKNKIQGVEQLFQEYLSDEAKFLTAQIDTIKNNKDFQHLFIIKNRESLFKLAKPVFDKFYTQYKITHFYFTDLSRVNFLRVHNFEKH
ncbi:MAG: hypothetical protein GY699_19965, partial [Desulfobacteraceae bacterium]|nr:hypothetical protein [Desulfobacteraceae bacterium]